jgi:hypothetical protein
LARASAAGAAIINETAVSHGATLFNDTIFLHLDLASAQADRSPPRNAAATIHGLGRTNRE